MVICQFLILLFAICSCDGVAQIYLINEPVANQPDLCTHENLPSISNGKVDAIRKNNLSTLEITCDIGFEYEKSSGPTNLTCVDNCEWQWQGAIPSCSPSNVRASPSNDSQDYLTVSLSLLSVILSGLLVVAIGAIIIIRVQKLQKIKRSKSSRQRDSFSQVEMVGLGDTNRLRKSSMNTPRHLAIKMMCTMQTENDILLPVDSINMENKIGAGGGGQIFRGRFGTIAVALKEDFAMVIGSKFGIIAREAGILMKLRHPNIVRFYGMWRQRSERLFLVMELCQIDLEKHIQNSRASNYSKLSSLRLLDFATQISDAVQYLHGRIPAIIHRDIKPANILLDDNMRCKLSDFGLARLTSTQSTNKEVGTMAYMPPEMMTPYVLESEMGCHVKAKQRLTKRAGMFWDVYSLGVTFGHMFTKLRPFPNLKDKQIYDEVTRNNRPKLNSFVPQPMVRLISRMWHQDPWERPTAKEVQHILCEMNTHLFILKFGRQMCSVPANSSIIPKFPSIDMEAEGLRFCSSKLSVAERYRAATLPTKHRACLKDKASKYQHLVIDVKPVCKSHRQFVRRRPCSV